MVAQPIEVDVQIDGRDVPAGRLWTHRHGQSESASFSYLGDYLRRVDAYELDPGLPLQAGRHQTALKQSLFGAMDDCAPDGWGRRLVRRADPSAVATWAAGQIPQAEHDKRLRCAYETVQLLITGESPDTVRAWFLGLNPQLDDQSPAQSIREGDLRDVLVAAKAFLAG